MTSASGWAAQLNCAGVGRDSDRTVRQLPCAAWSDSLAVSAVDGTAVTNMAAGKWSFMLGGIASRDATRLRKGSADELI